MTHVILYINLFEDSAGWAKTAVKSSLLPHAPINAPKCILMSTALGKHAWLSVVKYMVGIVYDCTGNKCILWRHRFSQIWSLMMKK